MGKDKKPFYNRWWVWLLAIVIIIGIAGGGEEDNTTSPEEVPAEEQEIKEEVEVEEPEPVEEESKPVEEEQEPEETITEEEIVKEEPAEPDEVEEVDREDEIRTIVESIVDEDFDSTEIREVKVNLNYGLEDGSFIVLPHLSFTAKNRAGTTRDMLEMYSQHLAAKLAEQPDISEITVFWEVPYHMEGENIAKFSYHRQGGNMAIGDVWYAPVIRP